MGNTAGVLDDTRRERERERIEQAGGNFGE